MEDGDGDWKEESSSRDTSTSARGPVLSYSMERQTGVLIGWSAGKKGGGAASVLCLLSL